MKLCFSNFHSFFLFPFGLQMAAKGEGEDEGRTRAKTFSFFRSAHHAPWHGWKRNVLQPIQLIGRKTQNSKCIWSYFLFAASRLKITGNNVLSENVISLDLLLFFFFSLFRYRDLVAWWIDVLRLSMIIERYESRSIQGIYIIICFIYQFIKSNPVSNHVNGWNIFIQFEKLMNLLRANAVNLRFIYNENAFHNLRNRKTSDAVNLFSLPLSAGLFHSHFFFVPIELHALCNKQITVEEFSNWTKNQMNESK